MKPAVQIQNVSKMYQLGSELAGYRTLRESLSELARVPVRWLGGHRGAGGRGKDRLWALQGVNFEVQHGEVVGIIGHNGAGKSTLLKILSRITEPTDGRIVIRGRVGSLLEVGTGFHPELTGRENVFLNGAILGMSQREIVRKFDEIVAFSEVERFIDTPVKRYSSGMYVRLAFAVAAHLEPEILVIDEVLAVGDTAFQKKCIGRMNELSHHGATVLLVSHNMGLIASLCQRAVILDHGRVSSSGSAEEQVRVYGNSLSQRSTIDLSERQDRTGSGDLRLTGVSFSNSDGAVVQTAIVSEPLSIRLDYEASVPLGAVEVSMWFSNDQGTKTTVMSNRLTGDLFARLPDRGSFVCKVPEMILTPGAYLVDVALVHNNDMSDYINGAGQIEVEPGPFFPTGRTPLKAHGTHMTRHSWTFLPADICTAHG